MQSISSITEFELPSGTMRLPVYLPDATFGVVRSVDAQDLEACGVQGLVMNVYHLMQKPGSSTVQSLGGLHKMSDWKRPIITDSGGFQVYSLVRQNPKFGQIQDKGITFYPEGKDRKYQLTPEKSIQLQLSFDADVVICLDDCTHVDDSAEEQALSVKRTIAWAKRCKSTFETITKNKKYANDKPPKIFAVVQGGASLALRKQCAEALLEIGFDGYGYGGWPLDAKNNLLTDILAYTRELIPREFPMHALGIGHPYNVVKCYQMGYEIFDCAMPTRDARHGRLYRFRSDPDTINYGGKYDWLQYVYINDDKHIKGNEPISPYCDCACCKHYSIAYLRHLFKMNDGLFFRLATIHNLRLMTQLMQAIRGDEDGA
ncbi:MAG: queuine tRNA-ribosyltransferase family protein [Anaerolineaceae bacterium]|nr:queuine tRNA-ribosyltransferase family protein [Anaerolineaceae bacterium]